MSDSLRTRLPLPGRSAIPAPDVVATKATGLRGRTQRGRSPRGGLSFRYRLVLGMLAVFLPAMGALAFALQARASHELSLVADAKGEGIASATALMLDQWCDERTDGIAALAANIDLIATLPDPTTVLSDLAKDIEDFTAVGLLDLDGNVRAASSTDLVIDPIGTDWFDAARAGENTISSLEEVDGRLSWVVAGPVLDETGEATGVVFAGLNVEAIPELLHPRDEGGEIVAIDAQERLVYSSDMGSKLDAAALLEAGSLGTTIDDATLGRQEGQASGRVRWQDPEGHDVVGGYVTSEGTGWTIVSQENEAAVLGPVKSLRRLALALMALGALAVAVCSYLLARHMARPIDRLNNTAGEAAAGDLAVRVTPGGGPELATLGDSFNAMLDTCEHLVDQVTTAGVSVNAAAAELSSSSGELAATTTEQSAAVFEASATAGELATASAAIADIVDEVALQTADTRDGLEQAEVDIQASSERTLELSRRVDDIGALLSLINEIAGQTDLLALNAAIEAARAGEEGRGFAVVAEEVRRLAERSKASAADIAAIIGSVQVETKATVMAMEKGAKQMHQGLALLERVTSATANVRMTTQQQRSATSQVVETMDQLTEVSRQVSTTAQQIASAAGDLAHLAGTLEASGTGAREQQR